MITMSTYQPPQPVTTDAEGEPTATPQPKVIAATAGAGVGAALSTIGVYTFESLSGVDLPTTVEGAVLVLITTACTFAAGYIKRPSGVS